MGAAVGAVWLSTVISRGPQHLPLSQPSLQCSRAQVTQKSHRCISVIISSVRRGRAGMRPTLHRHHTDVGNHQATLLLALCSMLCSGVTRQGSAARGRRVIHGNGGGGGSTGITPLCSVTAYFRGKKGRVNMKMRIWPVLVRSAASNYAGLCREQRLAKYQ